MIWLGDKRGYFSDWLTQQWVRATGRRIRLAENRWLDGPAGDTKLIGREFFDEYARRLGLRVSRHVTRGLISDFAELSGCGAEADHAVKDFYERTSNYELDAWSQWCGLFRPFGVGLALLFSRRLQQLNVPLSALDTSRGMTSEVIAMHDPESGELLQTAWVRELRGTNQVLYAGAYSVCTVPGFAGRCVKVVFPLPNGNAIVIMRPEVHKDGSLVLRSAGREFGDPGFYFVVQDGNGAAWARYVRNMKETIHVYSAEADTARADHDLRLWGMRFLRLHYRMRRRA
ncbi:MAG: hypothetical protein HYX27_18000 [Acidobacteria bacterium]|nr:hypothetical protein [Acidobacteriota bacterium]